MELIFTAAIGAIVFFLSRNLSGAVPFILSGLASTVIYLDMRLRHWIELYAITDRQLVDTDKRLCNAENLIDELTQKVESLTNQML